MPRWKRCKTCRCTMRLARIHGIPMYRHPYPLQKKACDRMKAAKAGGEA